MRTSIRASFFCVLLFLVAGATGVAHAQTSPSQDERKLFHLLNQERQKAGLPKLQWDNHLAKSAGGHALLLAEHQGLSHQFSGEPQLGERVGATGLRFTVSAENVASAQTVEDAHKGLMNSPPHRANILSPEFNAVGLAVIPRVGAVYVAQNFAYVLPVYSEAQFRSALLEAFRNARQEKGFSKIAVRPDPKLHEAACSDNPDARKLLRKLNGDRPAGVHFLRAGEIAFRHAENCRRPRLAARQYRSVLQAGARARIRQLSSGRGVLSGWLAVSLGAALSKSVPLH